MRSSAACLAPAALQEDKSHKMLQNLSGLGSEHNPASVTREERRDGAVAVGLVLGPGTGSGSHLVCYFWYLGSRFGAGI